MTVHFIFYRIMAFWLGLTLWPLLGSSGENLIKNGNVDGKDLSEFFLDSDGDTNLCRFSVFVEDLTWNHCAKLEFPKYAIYENGKKYHLGSFVVGGARGPHGEDGRQALDVKPDTTYEVSFEMRGTVGMVFMNLSIWEDGCASAAERKDVYTSLGGGGLKVLPGWTAYRGTLTTGLGAKKAALRFGVFWNESFGWEQPSAAYLLVDNISIREKSGSFESGLSAAPPTSERKRGVLVPFVDSPAPTLDGKLDDAAWSNAVILAGFTEAKTEKPVNISTEGYVLALPDALWIGVRCSEPAMDKLRRRHAKDGGEIWEDDCIEVFFDTLTEDVILRQFIVGAGGVRFMGWGNQMKQPKNYNDWQAAVACVEKEWTVEIRLPYKVLGWDARPAAGTTVAFNLGRERYAGEAEPASNWNPTGGDFHNKNRYGVLAFGDFAPDARSRLVRAQEVLRALPAEVVKEIETIRPSLRGRLADDEKKCTAPLAAAEWERIYLDTEQIHQDAKWAARRVKFRELSQKPFVVTAPAPTDDVTLPLMPDAVFDAPEEIECFAALNEYESLPILVSNLTERPEAYRVILFGHEDNGIEVPGLEGQDGVRFPAEKIEMREAVRIKDSDEPSHGYRFDALPLMNQARTITVPPKDSGMVWITFRVANVQAGTYRGTLRVIPLNQSASWELKPGIGWVYVGKAKDIPITLTVWPIDLPKDPPKPLMLCRSAENEKFFTDMVEHGNRIFAVTPWYFITSVNSNGTLGAWESAPGYAGFQKLMENHLRWIRESGCQGWAKFWVGCSTYRIFTNQIINKKLVYNSPEWRKAYLEWIRLIDRAFKNWNVDYKDYIIQVWDEPSPDEQDEVLLSLKLLREACPSIRTQIDFGHRVFPVAKLREMVPYVDIWGPNNQLFIIEEQNSFFREIAAKGKPLWPNICATSLRLNLYNYYRLQPWKCLYFDAEAIEVYTYTTGPGGHYGRGCWKTDAGGGLIYRSFDEPVPSIRYECLREGMDDLKYMAKLAEVVAEARKKTGSDKTLIKKAEAFLTETPKKVANDFPYKETLAEEARRQAARFILELQAAANVAASNNMVLGTNMTYRQ